MSRLPAADERLVRSLHDQHGPALLGYVNRLTSGDRQRAEDFVQETILRAWQHPELFTEERRNAGVAREV